LHPELGPTRAVGVEKLSPAIEFRFDLGEPDFHFGVPDWACHARTGGDASDLER
jgi:hypothetical protein